MLARKLPHYMNEAAIVHMLRLVSEKLSIELIRQWKTRCWPGMPCHWTVEWHLLMLRIRNQRRECTVANKEVRHW